MKTKNMYQGDIALGETTASYGTVDVSFSRFYVLRSSELNIWTAKGFLSAKLCLAVTV
jgi:hypothetical protein